MLEFPHVTFNKKHCRQQINSLRKCRSSVECNNKFHISHIYKQLQKLFQLIHLEVNDTLYKYLFSEIDRIDGIPNLINALILECIRYNCSPHFLRNVIDQYDSNGDISGTRLLISINRLRRSIWEYNILERVECIESMFYTWSFRKCIFEMECVNEVKPSLYSRATIVTKILHKANMHPLSLDQFATNSMLIFDMLHDEFLEDQNNQDDDKISFSFDNISTPVLLDCIKSLGLDVNSNIDVCLDMINENKKRKIT